MKIKPAVERQLTVEKSRQKSHLGEMCGISIFPCTVTLLGESFPSCVLLVGGLFMKASTNQSGEQKQFLENENFPLT